MRVSIRQPLQPFIRAKAQELGINDEGEVVNYILLQTIEQTSEQAKTVPTGTVQKRASKSA